jgi:hypothetical protein
MPASIGAILMKRSPSAKSPLSAKLYYSIFNAFHRAEVNKNKPKIFKHLKIDVLIGR